MRSEGSERKEPNDDSVRLSSGWDQSDQQVRLLKGCSGIRADHVPLPTAGIVDL